MSQPRFPIYEVEWLDSAHTPGWRAESTDYGTSICLTVGYLLHRDRAMVSLVQSQSQHGSVAEIISIPRVAVRSMKRLK